MNGTLTERRPGVWRLRVVAGYRPDGQPKQLSRTVTGTRRQAERALAAFITEVDNGQVSLAGSITMAAFLERWLEHVRAHRQPDTIRNYVSRCKGFKEEIGKIHLDKLSAQDLDRLYLQWMKKGLEPSTIRAYHGVLSSALSQAVKWGLVTRSVAPLATLPMMPRRRQTTPEIADIRQLIEASDETDPILSAIIALAALTGMRRGELCGLQWGDIDRTRMILHIRRSVKREEDHRVLRVGDTKTHADRRISLDPVTLGVLDVHRRRAEGWAAAGRVSLAPDAFILSMHPAGTLPMDPDVITHRFSRLAKAEGIECRFHDLRHAAATSLIGAGFDVATVAGRLGHANPAITLRVYAHALAERDRDAAAYMGALMSGDPPNR